MPVIGVTGSFGSGKSTVAGMFSRRGAMVFDADRAVHELLKGRGAAVRAVVSLFGSEVRSSAGIDRARLGAIVFDDQAKLKALMEILHPFALRQAEKFIRRYGRRGRLLVMDVPLLIESGWDRLVDVIVVVKAARKQQLERVFKRSGTKAGQALKRIKQQMPLREKLKFADYVIDNGGSQSDTNKQVRTIILELTHKQRPNRR